MHEKFNYHSLYCQGCLFTVFCTNVQRVYWQYFFPMDDGSGLKLTVAKYLTPKRYDISKQYGEHLFLCFYFFLYIHNLSSVVSSLACACKNNCSG